MFSAFRKLLADRRGVVSIELALVVPLMATLLFGIYELGAFVRVNMKLAAAATSMADLVAQQTAGVTGGSGSALTNFCNAGKMTMNPFPTSATSGNGSFAAAIASVTNYTSSGVTVDWESDNSCTAAATAMGNTAKTLATASTNLLPNAGAPGDSVIVVQVTYQYASIIHYLVPGTVTLTQTAFARPRNNATVACTSPC